MRTATTASHAPASRCGQTWAPWLVAWLGGPVLGIANGTIREALLNRLLGQRAARPISAVLLIGLLAGYFASLDRRWPIPARRTALEIGAAWAGLTTLFEFGFGHYVAGDSWADLLEQYDVTHGNAWPLVLLWIALGPSALLALRALSQRRG